MPIEFTTSTTYHKDYRSNIMGGVKGGITVIQLTAVHRRLGEYWRSLDARSIASGGIRLWKT